MGEWELSKASNKPCSKEQTTVKQPLLMNDHLVRTRMGRKLEIKKEIEDNIELTKAESERMRSSSGSYQTSSIQRTPKKASSALDLFNSFFSNNVKLEITSTTPSTSTTRRHAILTTTTTTTTTTSPITISTSNSGNSDTFVRFPDSESNLIQRNYLSDSDYIEIVDYMVEGTGDCCWFSRKK